jgi:hypothetical protein
MNAAGVVPTPVELTLDEVHQVAAGVAATIPSDYNEVTNTTSHPPYELRHPSE